MASIRTFFDELRRRRVIRALAAYGAVAWVLAEVSSVVEQALNLPAWLDTMVVSLALFGVPVVIVLAWVFDISPAGIEQTKELDEAGPGVKSKGGHRKGPALLPPAADSAIASICTLPFEVLSSDPEDRFIAQGVSAEISSALSKLKGVRVVSRATLSGASDGADARELGAQLGVQYLLSGNLRRHQEKIRIIVELVDTRSGQQLWTETYHRVLDNVMEAEEEIAGAIVGAFGGEQLRAQIKKANEGETSNHTAWSLVHKSRAYVLNYGKVPLAEAEAFARQAVALDPDYAAAHAALAAALSERVTSGLSEDPERELAEAVAAVETALARTPADPFVLKLAGNVLQYAGRHDDAIEQLRRAVGISAFDLGAWGYLGGAMAASDDVDERAEAQQILDRILQMAPQHPGAGFWLHHKALAFSCDGDYAHAEQYARSAVHKQPGLAQAWYLLSNARACQQNDEGARKALARATAANPDLTAEKFLAYVLRTSPTSAVKESRTAGLVRIGAL